MTTASPSQGEVAKPIPLELLAQILGAMKSYTELSARPGSDFETKLNALHQRIKNELPDFDLPPLYMIMNVPDFNNTFKYSLAPANLMTLSKGTLPDRGIYVTWGAANALTVDELIVSIAHEYGHAYYDHEREVRQNSEKMPLISLATVRRSMECQADYFAARFLENAEALTHSAAAKLRKASGLGDDMVRDPASTHPLDEDRLRGRNIEEAVGISPVAMRVTFDDVCNATIAPPPTPSVQSAPLVRTSASER